MSSLPASAYCGDTISFTASFASGTTGEVFFRHVETGKLVKIAPSISGETWTVTVAPIDTAESPVGAYSVKAITELSGVRETVDLGNITLIPPIDRPPQSTHARKMVALLERHLEGRIDDAEGRGLETYTVGGVPITKLSFESARALLEKYRRDLQAENAAERAALGLGTGRRILPVFE